MAKKLTTDEFIAKAKLIHGDKYDYSESEYNGDKVKLKVKCPIHGAFFITPHSHLRGCGCKECGIISASASKSIGADEFIAKAKAVHGDKYDYSSVIYVDYTTPVSIICKEHGEFTVTPKRHINGVGCPVCEIGKRNSYGICTTEDLIREARKVHSDKYDYSLSEFSGMTKDVTILCPEHGEFKQTPREHLNGSGCPLCANNNKYDTEGIIKRFKEIHGDKYDYSKVEYKGSHEKVCIVCPEHGEFFQTPNNHIFKKAGCPVCAGKGKTVDDFISVARRLHSDKYDYSKVKYVNAHEKVCIVCPKHGEFFQTPNNHINNMAGCPKCAVTVSKWENEVNEFIRSLGVPTVQSDRSVIEGGEIDIFIPSLSIGVECDGLRWHSDIFKDDSYHLRKTEECHKRGIRLLHIFEDEWAFKKDIVKSRLSNVLGKTETRLHARKCSIVSVPSDKTREFLNNNHIQGYANSSVNYGLEYCGEIVSIMTFGKPRVNLGGKTGDGRWELVRFCNKINTIVNGAASRLFKHFIRENNPEHIVSYSDKRFASGNVYDKLGFVHTHDSKPNYFYVNGMIRENRFKYRKSVLVKDGFDLSLSEREIMKKRGLCRIYDCGTKVYEWNNEKG